MPTGPLPNACTPVNTYIICEHAKEKRSHSRFIKQRYQNSLNAYPGTMV
jgi:hypothetical protein